MPSDDDARTLRVTVNGEPREVPAPATVARLLEHLEMDPRQVAVERNEKLVRRADFAATGLRDGDRLEVVTFFGGG